MAQHRALEWLHTYGRRYPKAWDIFAMYQEFHTLQKRSKSTLAQVLQPGEDLESDFPDWPDWCWAPLAGAHAVITHHAPEEVKRSDPLAPLPDTGGLGAVAAWRSTQGIYRFDRTLFDEVFDAQLTGKLPCEVLKRLPEWCCYIEMPVPHVIGEDKLRGFFVHLEYDVTERAEILRFALDLEGHEYLRPLMVHLADTMEEGLERTLRHYRKGIIRRYNGLIEAEYVKNMLESGRWDQDAELLRSLTSVAVFLCCEENDVPAPAPRPPRFAKTKKGRVIVPTPSKGPKVYECGYRIGAALRWATEQREKEAYDGPPTGRTVEGHVRRAHYHHFWRGSRKPGGERELVLKFLSPILVNLKDVPQIATIRPVR